VEREPVGVPRRERRGDQHGQRRTPDLRGARRSGREDALDARPEGVKYVSVERCPVYGGKVVSFDASKTKAVPGVRDVIQVPSGIAVIADNTWAAMQGRKALRVTWDEAGNGAVSSATIRQMFMQNTASGKPSGVARKVGDVDAALAKATRKIEAVYESPFLAHATMEPMNCTIHARPDGTAEAWVSTQSSTTCRKVIADTLGIAPEKVTFHTLYCGGGYGRRGEGAMMHVYEAAEVAKRVDGPIKVTWSREEDIQHDMFRPPALARMAGALDAEGWPAAFRAQLACPVTLMLNKGIDGTAVNGLSDMLYAFPDCAVEYFPSNSHIPVSFWRSPGASSNNFMA
jgi:isoquinoline 1-oxidoreductase beta subunit